MKELQVLIICLLTIYTLAEENEEHSYLTRSLNKALNLRLKRSYGGGHGPVKPVLGGHGNPLHGGINPGLGSLLGGLSPGFGGHPGAINPGLGHPGPGIIGGGLLPGGIGGLSPVGSSQTCRRWCRTPERQAYCCEKNHEPETLPFVKPGLCPPVRPQCPPVRNFRPPQACSNDSKCGGVDKCCFDRCLEEHVCKPPQNSGGFPYGR